MASPAPVDPGAGGDARRTLPRYPVYVPSKNRLDVCFTVRCLADGGVPFSLVVEPQEAEAYRARWGAVPGVTVLPLPADDRGVTYARNFIRDHAEASGAARHWQLDDNIRHLARRYRGKRVPCDPGLALRVCEDFTDRYTNIGLSGLNYMMFVPDSGKVKPYAWNVHVYSCTLVNHAMPYRWRLAYNEDTDICLQALAGGWCTVLLNTFLCQKIRTMITQGGNTADLYQGDGRLRMARALERMWPGVVTVDRRYGRPQHVIKDSWKRFDTKPVLRDDVDLVALAAAGPNEYGMRLANVGGEIRSPYIRGLLDRWRAAHPDGAPYPGDAAAAEAERAAGRGTEEDAREPA